MKRRVLTGLLAIALLASALALMRAPRPALRLAYATGLLLGAGCTLVFSQLSGGRP
ncbi:MAG TPA: hypothetical protein VGG42_18860 [Acidobacteriaceae bacterium]